MARVRSGEAQWGRSPLARVPHNSVTDLALDSFNQAEGRVRALHTSLADRLGEDVSSEVGRGAPTEPGFFVLLRSCVCNGRNQRLAAGVAPRCRHPEGASRGIGGG